MRPKIRKAAALTAADLKQRKPDRLSENTLTPRSRAVNEYLPAEAEAETTQSGQVPPDFTQSSQNTQGAQDYQGSKADQALQRPQALQESSASQESIADQIPQMSNDSACAAVGTLQQAAHHAIVFASRVGKGDRDPIFAYARAVKAFEATRGSPLDQEELRGAFNIWWSQANKLLPDLDYDECVFCFYDSYKRARTPLGEPVFETAQKRMETTSPPPEVSRYTSPKIKRLVHLCWCMAFVMKGQSFYLGSRDAGRAIGVSWSQAAIYLNGLVTEGILGMVKKGTAIGRRGGKVIGHASCFRYLNFRLPTVSAPTFNENPTFDG